MISGFKIIRFAVSAAVIMLLFTVLENPVLSVKDCDSKLSLNKILQDKITSDDFSKENTCKIFFKYPVSASSSKYFPIKRVKSAFGNLYLSRGKRLNQESEPVSLNYPRELSVKSAYLKFLRITKMLC